MENNKQYKQCKCKQNEPVLNFAKTKPNAIIPNKEIENAGYDIYACFEGDSIEIKPHETKMIPTGIASAISNDYVLLVRERGSTCKYGLSARSGVIDSGYRGEIFIGLTNTSEKPIIIDKTPIESNGNDGVLAYSYYKAIAQLLLVPVPRAKVIELDYKDLKGIPSKRGCGKLGSSGK